MKPPFIFTNNLNKDGQIYAFSAYTCLLLIYVIITLIFIIKAHTDFGSNTIDYFLLLENWRQPTISDIVLAKQGESSCPQEYSYMIPYEWGGSSAGCDCRYANPIQKLNQSWSDIGSGSCSYEQREYGCSNIPSLSARAMPKWAGGTLWCVKRDNEETFAKRGSLVQRDGNCKSGYKKCGFGGTFKNNRVFCTASSQCPINSIVLSKSSPGGEFKEGENFTTNQGPGYALYWSRNESNVLPIVEWRVSEEEICMNNKKNHLASGHDEYTLVNVPRVKCDYDNRFSVMDWMSEKAFFFANNFDNIVNLLPTYTLSNDINWKLYYRSFIDFKIDCRYLIPQLLDSENEAIALKNSINTSVIVVGVFLGIFFVSYIIFTICIFVKNDKSEDKRVFNIIGFLINYILRIICIAMAGSVKKKIVAFDEIFEFVKGMNCSDELTNDFFNNLSDDLESSVIRDLDIVIFFNVALIVFDIVLGIVSYFVCHSFQFCSKNDEANEEPFKQLNSQKQYNTFDGNYKAPPRVEMGSNEDFPTDQLKQGSAAQDNFSEHKTS